MGMIYEIISTPVVYAKKAVSHPYPRTVTGRSESFRFGPEGQQHCVLWEPAELRSDDLVVYFHGGAYLVGTPESMEKIARVYNAEGYRFCAVGFRHLPRTRFPGQIEDAFRGTAAALEYLEKRGRTYGKIFVGGNSAGGHAASVLAFSPELRKKYGIPEGLIRGCLSIGGITALEDMLRGADEEVLDRFSPERLAGKGPAVPFLAVHGRADRMSPYRSEERFVRLLNRVYGDGTARLITIDDPKWQHMVLTVTLYESRVEDSPVLSSIFSWMHGPEGE
jgi:pimeloyl-ACP methyl ester carboxylesterase